MLLDIVVEVETLGMNMWAVVGDKFNSRVDLTGRLIRKVDSLKLKFDKLSNSNKPTGDPLCPEPVRRAKRISRAILRKAAAASLGLDVDDDDDEMNVENETESVLGISNGHSGITANIGSIRGASVGVRANRREPGSCGIKTPGSIKTDPLLSSVERIDNNIETMTSVFATSSISTTHNIQSMIRDEVKQATSEDISELKSMMKMVVDCFKTK